MDKQDSNTRLFTIFLSQGYGGAGQPPESLVTNDELLAKLRADCPGIEFITRDTTLPNTSVQHVLSELESLKPTLDGVLVVGTSREYGLALTGLPTIVVYNLFEWMMIPYKLFNTGREEDSVLAGDHEYGEGRVLTAQLDRRNNCAQDDREAMYQDLLRKIKLIQVIKKLAQSRILSVAQQNFLAEIDYQGDIHKKFPSDYNESYTNALKTSLGVEIVRAKPEEFYEAYRNADKAKAEKTAGEWIRDAAEVTASKSEIVKTAAAYLAFEELREKYGCNAVSTHMRTLTGSGKVGDMFWPGLALECGFKTRGIQAVCQNYPDILVTQLLGYFLTGKPSMLGDLMVDTYHSVDILTHCGAPVNPYGDERKLPYKIQTHAESPVRTTQAPGSSTGLQVEWPVGEPVTVWKLYALHKTIGIHTGTIVDGNALYENLDEIMCRTKLVVKTQAEEVQKHYSPDEYGIHRAATLGDLKKDVKDFAVLAGFGVFEEDKASSRAIR